VYQFLNRDWDEIKTLIPVGDEDETKNPYLLRMEMRMMMDFYFEDGDKISKPSPA